MVNHEEKINKAKVKIQLGNPFFSYLSLFLKIKPDLKGELPENAGGGVDYSGNLIYKTKFLEELSDSQVATFIAHEILHLAFNHLTRLGTRNLEVFNWATDLVVNNTLVESGFETIEGTLTPYNNSYEFQDKDKVILTIERINEKTAEMIYEEIMTKLPEKYKKALSKKLIRYDEHIFGKGLGIGEKEEIEELWKKRIEEGSQLAKMVGKLPSGIERYLDELKAGKINWKSLLERYIQKAIPTDYTWLKRSKKSLACGFYLPNQEREKIDVSIAVDTSGSIGTEELTTFISEIISLSRAYKDRVDMRILVGDTKVEKDYLIENGNIAKIKQMDILGGGGTSHIEIVNYCRDKIRNNKLLICFTDGYSDLEQIEYSKYPFEVLVILSKGGKKDLQDEIPCKVIQLKD